MKKLLLSLLGLTLVLSSCNEKNPGSENNTLSAEEQKKVLSEVGSDMAKAIDVNDLKPLKAAVIELSNLLQQSPFPANSSSTQQAVSELTKSLTDILDSETLNPTAYWAPITKATIALSDYFARYTYNASTKTFEKSPASDGTYLTYPCSGGNVEVSCKPSTETYTQEINGDAVKIPKSINFVMTQGETTLMSLTVNIPTLIIKNDIQDKTNALNTEVILGLAQYRLGVNVNVSSSKGEISTFIAKGDAALLSIKAEANQSTSGASIFTASIGAVRVDLGVMNRLFAKGSTDKLNEYLDKQQSLKNEEQNAKTFNESFTIFCNFDDSNDRAFTIKMHPSGAYFVMVFSDESQYRVEDYFKNGFDGVIKAFKDLGESIQDFATV